MAGRGKLELIGGKTPKRCKARKDRWTEAKRNRFLAELAGSCNVAHALRKVRMGKTSLYALRKRSAAFRAAWAEAIREAYALLEMELLDRAMNGTVKTVTHSDGRTQTIREYPNGMAMMLLKRHRESAAAAEQQHDPEHIEEVRKRIMKKLAVVRKRIEDGEA